MTISERTRDILRSLQVPLLVLLIAILFSLWAFSTMEPTGGADSFDITQKAALALILYVFVFVIERFHEHTPSYTLLVVGLTIIFMGQVENILDEFVNITYGSLPIDLEDLDTVGLFLVGIGLLTYTNMLTKAKARTEQSQRETELYATLLRHDLRNDLQAVLGYIELAQKEGQNHDELLESARMATERMARLVKAFSIHMGSSEGSLISVIEKTARDAEKTHQGLTIDVTAEEGTADIEAYGGPLIQVAIENLFRNAFQYGGENPIVDVRARRLDKQVEIVISDNGPGIPSEMRDRVFQRGTTSTDSGLGLYLAKTIIKGCGGFIELLDSDSGATFRVLLPASS
ncbi:HAMP domain-containing histidine kinase [Candidatus Thorarchaeota archaeon]|nr:MAG: HAMP domain-containing histidine kinase [Candidatus Thorarchaeota archaeon]